MPPLQTRNVSDAPALPASSRRVWRWWRTVAVALLVLAALVVASVLVWQAIVRGGIPDPTRPGGRGPAATLDIAVLVFREGLESILVLAALTASMVGASRAYQRPIAAGVALGAVASLATWFIAVTMLDSLTENVSALHLQVITGLLAIVVLLVVMNWFFHKIYWSGWISLHTKRKKALLTEAAAPSASRARLLWGLVLLGFTSFYREGFEVVLFLQSYRLKLGNGPILRGMLLGTLLAGIVALLTFVAHHRLPYKRMLIATGAMLAVVLLVMVGEQAQEMQLAHWLSTTPVPALEPLLPQWAGLWFALFPTAETLAAQGVAVLLVVGSYSVVQLQLARARRR
jgi:high-affinity iron transporter